MAWWFALALAVVGVAAFTQSATGFGFALLSAPVLLVGLDARTTVATLLLLHTLECALVVVDERRRFRRGRVMPLVVGGLLGTPIGALALRAIDPRGAQVAIGAMVAVSGAFLLVTAPRPLPGERGWSVFAGLVSGALNSSTGLSGPPVALYLSNQGWSRDHFRTSLMATFLVSNVAALLLFLPLGLLDWAVAGPSAVLAPAVLVGWLVHRATRDAVSALDAASFRRVVGGLVVVAGVASVLRG